MLIESHGKYIIKSRLKLCGSAYQGINCNCTSLTDHCMKEITNKFLARQFTYQINRKINWTKKFGVNSNFIACVIIITALINYVHDCHIIDLVYLQE